MLATSNVPVWAAEDLFSDGSNASASVTEVDKFSSSPEEQSNTDIGLAAINPTDTSDPAVKIEGTAKPGETLKAIGNREADGTNPNEKVYYVWDVDGERKENEADTFVIPEDADGKTITVEMKYTEDGNTWNSFSPAAKASVTIYAYDTIEEYFDNNVSVNYITPVENVLSFSGNITPKANTQAKVTDIKWINKDTGAEVPDDYKVTASDLHSRFVLKAFVETPQGKDGIVLGETQVVFTADESITGNVQISNEHNDQWGYKVTAHYDANLPENTGIQYIWQTYNTDTEKWDTVQANGIWYGKADGEYYPTKEDAGKKLRVIAKFLYKDTEQVIIEKESNEYEVKPLSFNKDEISVYAYYDDDLEEAVVDYVEIAKEDSELEDGGYFASTSPNAPYVLEEGKDYEVITQNINRPGQRTITIKLIGAFSGERTESLSVGKYDLNDADVTLKSNYVEFVGDGKYAIPEIEKVTWAGDRATLKEGTDYEIDEDAIQGNIYAGEQWLRLRGIGDFANTWKSVEYQITARNLENCKVVWTGKPIEKGETPKAGVDVKNSEDYHFVVVDAKGYVLVPGKDYTYETEGLTEVSQQKCRVIINATATTEDKVNNVWTGGNYYGQIKSDYVTVGHDLSEILSTYVESVVKVASKDYTGKEITFSALNKIYPEAVSQATGIDEEDLGFSDPLEVGVDYDLNYLNNVNAYYLKDKDGKLLDVSPAEENMYIRQGYFRQNKVDSAVENDDPQAPQVSITLKGKYSGSTTPVRFSINQVNFAGDTTTSGTVIFDPSVTDASAVKGYEDQIKALVVKDRLNNTLVNTKDYVYDYYYVNDTKDVSTENGKFTVEYEAHQSQIMYGGQRITVYDGNYYGSRNTDITIDARSLEVDSISVAPVENQKYTGKLIEPKVTVKDGAYTLVEGTDYELSYKDNRSAGTATIYITGLADKGRYKDEISTTFVIENKSIADAKFLRVGAYRADYTDLTKYTEKDFTLDNVLYDNDRPVEPEFTVVDANNNELIRGYDYTVEFENNTKVGTGKIIVTGKGDYEGTLEGTFEIIGKGISGHFVEESIPAQTYTGEEIKPEVTFVPDSPNLELGRDYEIIYEYNVNPGKGDASDINNKGPKVVAHGIGQYAGYVKLGFEIKKADITTENVTAEAAVYAGGKVAEAEITVINPASGKALEEGKDYKVEYVSGKEVGDTGRAIIYLVNNECYTFNNDDSLNASIEVNYDIVAMDLKDTVVDPIQDQIATGEQIKPALTVKNGDVVLKEGVDYQVTYGENTEVGVGSATITPVDGNKNYVGSKEISFNIVAETPEVGQAIISNVRVSGNTLTPVLSGEVDGAVGYDYVLSTEEDYVNGRVQISKNVLNTNTSFYYVEKGTYYVYCHAWKRDDNGLKVFGDWSNIMKVEVTATTPERPQIVSAKLNGKNLTVTWTRCDNATGYDIVMGKAARKVNGEMRPVDYGKAVKKITNGDTVTVTFRNIPKGTYYVGLHAWNRTSESGVKVFSPWSNGRKVVVK